MTVEALLRSGGESEAAGDLESAEAAYREADELQDDEAPILLGFILKRKGDLDPGRLRAAHTSIHLSEQAHSGTLLKSIRSGKSHRSSVASRRAAPR